MKPTMTKKTVNMVVSGIPTMTKRVPVTQTPKLKFTPKPTTTTSKARFTA